MTHTQIEVGFLSEDMDRKVGLFSGGWKARSPPRGCSSGLGLFRGERRLAKDEGCRLGFCTVPQEHLNTRGRCQLLASQRSALVERLRATESDPGLTFAGENRHVQALHDEAGGVLSSLFSCFGRVPLKIIQNECPCFWPSGILDWFQALGR